MASVSDEVPAHTTPSFKEIEAYLMEAPQTAGPYDVQLLLRYKSDDFEYSAKYIKDGKNCYDLMFAELVRRYPNWIRFLIEYMGLDFDSARNIYHHSVLKLSHLQTSRTNPDNIQDDLEADMMVGTLIVGFATTFCLENEILTYPRPLPGSAQAHGFHHSVAEIIRRAKADGAIVAGKGL